MKKILYLILLSASTFSQDLYISAESNREVPFKSVFKFKNDSDASFFCKKTFFNDLNYAESGEYIYSLDKEVTNVTVKSNSTTKKEENVSQELSDLVDMYPNLEVTFEDLSIQHNCEPLSTRLNNIYILDDTKDCGGSGYEVKKYILDNGNNRLVENGKKRIQLSKDAKILNLVEVNEVLVVNGKKIQILKDEKLIDVDINLSEELFISAFGVSEESFIILSYSYKGLKFYRIDIKGEKYYNSDVFQSDLAMINTDLSGLDSKFNILNKKETVEKLIAETRDVARSITVYVKMKKDIDAVTIALSYRLPSVRLFESFYDLNKGKYTGFKYTVVPTLAGRKARVKKSILEFNGGFKVVKTEDIDSREAEQLVYGDFYQRILVASKSLNYKKYKVNVRSNDKRFYSDNQESLIEGLCRPKLVYSDKTVSLKTNSVNQRFKGNTLLNMAVKRRNYSKALMLIANGANIEKVDIMGKSPIYYSIFNRDLKMTKLLVENGAKITTLKKVNFLRLFERMFRRFDQLDSNIKTKYVRFFVYILNQTIEVEGYKLSKNERYQLEKKMTEIDELVNYVNLLKDKR